MRSAVCSLGWTSFALLPFLFAIGCGGTPDAPQAKTDQGDVPATRVPDPAPPAERTPEQAASDTLRKFLYAMVERDQATIESISLPHPELSLLWMGEKQDPDYLIDAKKEIDSIAFSKLLPGDNMVDLSGKPMVVKEGDVKANELMVTFNENPIPFFLEKTDGAWKVHPTPIIASRKAAIAEFEAQNAEAEKGSPAQPPVQQPAVQTADQLGGARPPELKR